MKNYQHLLERTLESIIFSMVRSGKLKLNLDLDNGYRCNINLELISDSKKDTCNSKVKTDKI